MAPGCILASASIGDLPDLAGGVQGHFQIILNRQHCPLLQKDLSIPMRIMYASGVWSYVVGAISTPFFIIVPMVRHLLCTLMAHGSSPVHACCWSLAHGAAVSAIVDVSAHAHIWLAAGGEPEARTPGSCPIGMQAFDPKP